MLQLDPRLCLSQLTWSLRLLCGRRLHFHAARVCSGEAAARVALDLALQGSHVGAGGGVLVGAGFLLMA